MKREEELVQQEKRRAQEIYVSLKNVREQVKKKEAEEQQKEDDAWKVSELKAKEAEKERRNSVSLARREILRHRALEAKRRNTLGKTITIEAPPSLPARGASISIRPNRAPPAVPNHPPPPIPSK
jgi:DNA-binding transcriptional MerR regulator